MRRRIAEEWAVFLLAMQFMTRLPFGRGVAWTPERMAASPRWYAAVGVVVGAIAALVFALSSLVLPPVIAVLLAVVASILVTGALHEDGFADCCDGLGGAADKVRVLEIMRDSRIGTYGVLGLGLLLATKVAVLAAMPPAIVPAALVASHALSRASLVLVIATSRYVRPEGTGRSVGAGAADAALATGVGLAALVPLVVVAGESTAVLGLVGLVLGHLTMRWMFERRLGGYTGDCLGSVQQLSDLGFLLFLIVELT